MSTDDRRVCLCGESTGNDYAPGHDALHASELALAVHAGAISEAEAVAQIPTVDTVTRFEEILASRRSGRYAGGITTWGAWLDDAIAG